MKTFGDAIKSIREQENMSQRQLAKLVGVTPSYINDIERLRRKAPSKKVIQKLATVLSISEENLFDLAGLESDRIPPDVPEIIKRHPESVNLLRAIQKQQLSPHRIREIAKGIGGGQVKAVILAAGMGMRLKHMTEDLPKCMAIVFDGKTLLETQLETFRSCGVQDISIVRGYKAEKMNYSGVKYFLNDDYQKNNILESIFYAEEELDGDVIISYSDIWYEADVLKRLLRCDRDIAIGVDIDWKDYYLGRKDHPIEEAENVIFDSDGDVIKIGKIAAEKEEVHGEFIGMIKLSRRGCKIFRHHYHCAKTLYEGKPFQRAPIFERAYLTDMLQEMAGLGVPIHCEIIGSGWEEIGTCEDFEKAVAVFQKREELLNKNLVMEEIS